MRLRHYLLLTLAFAACAPAASGVGMAGSTPALDWGALHAVIDGPEAEAWISFHPSGRVVLFDRNTKDFKNHRIFMTRLVHGKWTPAEPVPFTAEFTGMAPHFSMDGKSILFASSRPLPGVPTPPTGTKPDTNIWRVPGDGKHWGTVEPVTGINSTWGELEAIEVADGTIYFASTRSRATNDKHLVGIYKAVPAGGGNYTITPVGAVDTGHYESTIYVTPDEKIMLFSRGDDPAGLGQDDIFVTYNCHGQWSPPIHLGSKVNSPDFDYGPELTRNRRTLLLTTTRNSGYAEIIAVPMPKMNYRCP